LVPAPGYLIDLTRLTSRLGRGVLTGIDRVELAYLQHLLAQQAAPIWGLVRTGLGYWLLDRPACGRLCAYASQILPLPLWARHWPRAPSRGGLTLLGLGHWPVPPGGLAGLLAHVPRGAVYLNLGHSNLSDAMLQAAQSAGSRTAALIHDTIPLDLPQFARRSSLAPFAAKIAAVARHADLVIHISQDARAKTERHFARCGRVPPGITAHLGVTLAAPTPPPWHPSRPYFLALGTIEPRKNLGLLLDIWQDMGPSDPQLVVIGARGWADAALFAQLARLQASGRVLHGENLPDGAVASLIQNALALLFPSHAEGFGLPPCEAAGRGLPVIAADLPVLHEICGNFPVYLDPTDSYSWAETIRRFAHAGRATKEIQAVPQWADHFRAVFGQFDNAGWV
jgi:glycosyltransferase involved in cell wall biosynthesis